MDDVAEVEQAPERIWVDVYDGPTYGVDGIDWLPYVEGQEPESDGTTRWTQYVRADFAEPAHPSAIVEAFELLKGLLPNADTPERGELNTEILRRVSRTIAKYK